MECLYNHLKEAHLSVIGQSTRRDLRASFIRRCQDTKVDEKLHLLRILSSTLKVTQKDERYHLDAKILLNDVFGHEQNTDRKQIKSVFISEL